MIFDRTQNDVDASKDLIKEKVQTFQTLTTDEVETLERGTLTINTLNRIESKQKEIASVLNFFHYYVDIYNKTDWNEGDIFGYSDFSRILSNLSKIKEAYYTFVSSPNIPDTLYEYQKLNDAEKLLVDIETIINNMKKSFQYMYSEIYMGGI